MSNFYIKDYKNKKFGRLTIKEFVRVPEKRDSFWRCLCSCGNYTILQSYRFTSGHTKSCGCLNIEKLKIGKRHFKGGISKNPLYWTLSYMKERCYNLKNNRYKNYGGRGIKVCDEWLESPNNFINWSIENGWKKGLSIDRIDNDGNYEPSNCRWITISENSKKSNRERKQK